MANKEATESKDDERIRMEDLDLTPGARVLLALSYN